MDLKEIDILGSEITHHWYYRSKAAAMPSLIDISAPSIILDVGAGSGFFSRYRLGHTTPKEAWCVDISYEVDSDALEMGKPMHYRRSASHQDVCEDQAPDLRRLSQGAAYHQGAIKIIAPMPSRQRSRQSTGRDPLRCPHCQNVMEVWHIWHPTYGVIYDELDR